MPTTPPVILLHGTDEYAIASAVEKLAASLADSSSAAMNIARFDGRGGVDFEDLNTAVNAIPFLSPTRLTVLAHATSLFSGARERMKFMELLEHVPPTTRLVLVESELLKSDHWLIKWAQKAGAEVRSFPTPRRRDMPGWIIQETKKRGGQIDAAAAARLADMVGEETRVAVQEILKLLTFVNFSRAIRVDDVEAAGVASAQSSVFDLVDALGTGDGKKAQGILQRLLEDGAAFELWGMVIRQFRLLLLAREIIQEGGGLSQVQRGLSLHEFVAEKVYHQAQRYSLLDLEALYHKLLVIDEGAKTSQMPLDLALDALVVELSRR